ncbi:hypothetical protein [uncultured Gammaproteobacteria bacterium]|nr:hypothetical protein [uncultured Gammaproteobacteria bacterium]CAC9628913.1 hypothetical protein [uncultured Gammaproteobacteria bacterium]
MKLSLLNHKNFSLLDKIIAMTIKEEDLERQIDQNNNLLFEEITSRFSRGNYLLQKKKYTSRIKK